MDTCTKSKNTNRVIGAHDQGGHHEQNNNSNYGNKNYSLHGTMAAADYGLLANANNVQGDPPARRFAPMLTDKVTHPKRTKPGRVLHYVYENPRRDFSTTIAACRL